MNVSLQIARRYLFGKKSTNAINLITGISVVGIAIGTTALLLILSVFNGFEALTKSQLDHYNPDLKIEATQGKFFTVSDSLMTAAQGISGVAAVSRTIEEVAHFEYNSRQHVGVMKGIDPDYVDVSNIDEAMVHGKPIVKKDDIYAAILGRGMYSQLNINLESKINSLRISVPNRKKRGPLDQDFKSRSLYVNGVFSIKNEKDYQFALVDYRLASALLDLRGQVSALEVKVENEVDPDDVVSSLRQIFPSEGYKISDRLEQDSAVLKIMNIEKWSSYLIFSFTLLLIIFNVIGCLWMIVLDKKKDISVLQSFGATKAMVKNIFLLEGVILSTAGFLIGLICSIIFYILQKTIGIITVPDGFAISAYPMEMEVLDVIIIMITVLTLGIIASLPAAFRATKVSAFVRME